jgi:hypothetical protein
MAGEMLKSEASERSPLLPQAGGNNNNERIGPVQKVVRWVTWNAILVYISTLLLGVVVALCVFFGGKSNAFRQSQLTGQM